MVEATTPTHDEIGGASRRRRLAYRKGGNLMTADQLKRKFRNFPTAHLNARLG